jgi:type II secretory pathway pseudopilin PulG
MELKKRNSGGFSMIEMVFGMMILGIVMIAFVGIFSLFQKSSAQSQQYGDAQQNARIALDFITDYVRQAGAGTDYVKAQRFIVHAGPYQVAINADIDNGQTIDGQGPLSSMSVSHSPNTVPPTGTAIYVPPRDYTSGAETVVLTLDSNSDGVISGSDQGDESEESNANPNLYVLKRVVYGFDGGTANDVRSTNLAVVRGPGAYGNGIHPQPLFSYYYDHDEDPATPHRLWGDTSNNGVLEPSEVAALTPVSDGNLAQIRQVHVTVTSEAEQYNKKFQSTDGHLSVVMESEVYVRNSSRSSSMIFGTVYHDLDADGTLDTGEAGMANVKVSLVGLSRETFTNSYGTFFLPVPSGSYTVRETDPPGYVSTTSNTVNANVTSGAAVQVDFGDRSGSPVGFIRGTVYDDLDVDGTLTGGEAGIPGVLLSLDTGEQTHTDDAGVYEFVVPVGSYVVVETDPETYSSTTPNSVDADILATGDTVTVNFGDSAVPVSGTLEGYVFEDDDMDGVRGGGEGGLSNVALFVSNGDSTSTDATGYYKFSLAPGIYKITERDEPGYTSSTVNTYVNIVIVADTVVTRNFGDFLINQNDYIEIVIGNTERALSVGGTDLKEDTKGDIDIVLGTPFGGGGGNLLVFLNKRKNASTALGALFDSSPNYRRDAFNNINTLSIFDFSADGKSDVLAGTHYNAGNNILIWFDGAIGELSATPSKAYTSSASTFVLDSELAELTNDSFVDLIVGLRGLPGTFTGGFQTLRSLGNGNLVSLQHVTRAGASNEWVLGEVWGLDAGDVNGDGDVDVVVGTHSGDYQGYVDVYFNDGNGTMVWNARYLTLGAVNDIKLINMMEDDGGDVDILAGMSSSANLGWLACWYNTEGAFGVEDTTGYAFPEGVTARWPNDAVAPNAEVLSLATGRVNPDIFPEIFFGTRNSSFYQGDCYVMETFGMLPTAGRKLNSSSTIGEVVTMELADFNKDNLTDLVVGTRYSATQGKLIIYFYEQ